MLSVSSKELLVKKYGQEEANKRIYATTDRAKGAVKVEADANGWDTFVVPDSVGGRFYSIDSSGTLANRSCRGSYQQVDGRSKCCRRAYASDKLAENEAYQYAVVRNILYRKGYLTEVLANYEPSLQYFSEWWKQLAGESEGKDQKGDLPDFKRTSLTDTCTLWGNFFKKELVSSLKQLFV